MNKEEETMLYEVCVVRPALTIKQRNQNYHYTPPQEPGVLEKIKSKVLSKSECSNDGALSGMKSCLPILDWLPSYSPKNSLLGDTISGVTVAIMHIPQGMAYALLASLPPICGMYMAFFPVLVYALFGTSRHCSVGTFAIVCIMTGKVVNELATFEDANNLTTSTSVTNSTSKGYSPVQVATTVAFMCGLWEIILGILQLGTLSVFLSDMVVSGFTTGAAVHVMTSQVKYLFGLNVRRYNGPLKIIYTYRDMFSKLSEANPATMVISSITIVGLVLNNELLKPRLRKITTIPIPIELIAVVLGTATSYFGDLNRTYEMRVVGKIPTGLPMPEVPPMELIPSVLVDSFVITAVGYTVFYSMAKIFANKHNYVVDATQELYALGISNIVGSFFSCAPIAASMSRSLIQESVGGVSLITSIISCSLMFFVLFFIGPAFEALPNCVLSAIIAVALKGMFLQINDMVARWKISRIDALVWICSFLGVVILDIDYGLVIGIIVSLFVLLARNQKPVTARLGHIPNTDIYLDKETYSSVFNVPGVMIFQFIGALHFANVEYFRTSLYEVTHLDPHVIKNVHNTKLNDERDTEATNKEKNYIMVNGDLDKNSPNSQNNKPVNIIIPDEKILILELGGMSSVDSTGAKFLAQLYRDYSEIGITLAFASISVSSYEILERCGSLKIIDNNHIFHSVHDAVVKLVAVPNSESSDM